MKRYLLLCAIGAVLLNGCSYMQEYLDTLEAARQSVRVALPDEVKQCQFITDVNSNMAATSIAEAVDDMKVRVYEVGGDTFVQTNVIVTNQYVPSWADLSEQLQRGVYYSVQGRAYLCNWQSHTINGEIVKTKGAAQAGGSAASSTAGNTAGAVGAGANAPQPNAGAQGAKGAQGGVFATGPYQGK